MSWIGSALTILAVVATVQLLMLLHQRRRLTAALRLSPPQPATAPSPELIDSLVAEGRITPEDRDAGPRQMLTRTDPIFQATAAFFALTVPSAAVCLWLGWFGWLPAAVLLIPVTLLALSVPILLTSLRVWPSP